MKQKYFSCGQSRTAQVSSVADPGSGANDPGIRNRFFPDPGTQTHIFERLLKILMGKKYYNS